jgi:hypothetical protein
MNTNEIARERAHDQIDILADINAMLDRTAANVKQRLLELRRTATWPTSQPYSVRRCGRFGGCGPLRTASSVPAVSLCACWRPRNEPDVRTPRRPGSA